MSVIDTHAHIVLPETLNVFEDLGPEIGGTKENPWFRAGSYKLEGVKYEGTPFMDVKLRLEVMDEMGLDFQALSPNPITYFHFIEPGKADYYCKTHNDALAKIVSDHPHTLGGFASLPMQDIDMACEELERSVKDLNLLGGYIGTDFPFELFSSPLDRFYKTCTDLNVPLFLHPAPQGINGPYADNRLDKYSLDLTIGFANDETIALSHLIFGGVLSRHSTLDICISHGGGNIAFLAGRLEKAAEKRSTSPEWIREEGAFKSLLQRIWFDNHVHQTESLELLNSIVGTKRQVLGTNFLGWDQPEKKSLAKVPTYLADNAKRLLRLDNI